MEEAVEPTASDVDQFGWSRNATIMFRLIFKLWWSPMLYRKMVKTARFYVKRKCSYFKRR